MTAPVFISHSSKDAVTAHQACQFLERQGITCWIAPRDITGGARYGAAIEKAIENALALVLLVSEHSNASEQVMNEVERAVNHRKDILPVKIEPVTLSSELQYFISRRHCLDATVASLDVVLKQLAEALCRLGAGKVASLAETTPLASHQPLTRALPGSKRQKTMMSTVVGTLVAAVVMVSVSMGPNASGDSAPHPQQATAANRRGWHLTLKNTHADDNRALEQYEMAIALHEKLAEAHSNKGFLRARMGYPEAALQSYQRAREIDASDPLIASLIREAKQQASAQKPETQARIKQGLEERRRQYKAHGEKAITSNPVEFALLPLQYDGAYPSRAGEREFVTHELEQALQKDGRLALVERLMTKSFASQIGTDSAALGEPHLAPLVRQNLLVSLILKGAFIRLGENTAIRLSAVDTASGNTLTTSIEEIGEPQDLPQVASRLAEKILDKLAEVSPSTASAIHIPPQNTREIHQPTVDGQRAITNRTVADTNVLTQLVGASQGTGQVHEVVKP